MDKIISDTIRRINGIDLISLDTDDKFVYITPTLSTDECFELFNNMTEEVFENYSHLLDKTTLMVHLFPPEVLNTSGHTLDKKPEGHHKFYILDKIILKTGTLTLCKIEFIEFGTTYNWWYFKHVNWKHYGDTIRNKFLSNGITPTNEWVLNYMTKDATMPKHVDAILPYIRYCFSIRQPVTEASIIINEEKFYIPEGTAYIMDGEIPHEIIHKSADPRIMMIGAIDYRGNL